MSEKTSKEVIKELVELVKISYEAMSNAAGEIKATAEEEPEGYTYELLTDAMKEIENWGKK